MPSSRTPTLYLERQSSSAIVRRIPSSFASESADTRKIFARANPRWLSVGRCRYTDPWIAWARCLFSTEYAFVGVEGRFGRTYEICIFAQKNFSSCRKWMELILDPATPPVGGREGFFSFRRRTGMANRHKSIRRSIMRGATITAQVMHLPRAKTEGASAKQK